MVEKTPEQLAEREVNKKLAKGIANRELEIKKHEAKIKKLKKQIEKIKSGELIPDEGSIKDNDDEDEDSSSTNVVFLLDESGSMSNCMSQTISGFNEYLDTLKKEKSKIKVSLTKFGGHRVELVYSNKLAKEVPKLSEENYRPDGMTPLFDAIGKTVGDKKGGKKTLFVIMTDGHENASREHSLSDVKGIIKRQEKLGWTFVYLGADQNAWGNAKDLGLSKGNTLSYCSVDTSSTLKLLSRRTIGFCRSGSKRTKNFWK